MACAGGAGCGCLVVGIPLRSCVGLLGSASPFAVRKGTEEGSPLRQIWLVRPPRGIAIADWFFESSPRRVGRRLR